MVREIMENLNKKATAQKIETAETPLDSANSKKQFDEPMDEILDLWDIKSESKYERKFVKLAEDQAILLVIPINLTESTVLLKTKFGNKPFLKVIEIVQELDNPDKIIPSLLQISSIQLRSQILKIVNEAKSEPIETITLSIYREGKGLETKYIISRLF